MAHMQSGNPSDMHDGILYVSVNSCDRMSAALFQIVNGHLPISLNCIQLNVIFFVKSK